MSEKKVLPKKMKLFGLMTISSVVCLLNSWRVEPIEAARVTGSHIGTFDGSTTFVTTSSNGVNPGLFIEVMDDEGNLTQYESEEGIIAIPDTKEGAYVTQAKLLGKTKYHDQDTGEVLDQFEEGRNLRLVSSENPGLEMSDIQFPFDKVKVNIDATTNPIGEVALNTINGETLKLNNPNSVEDVGFNGDYFVGGRNTNFSYDYNGEIYACEVIYEQYEVTNSAWGNFVDRVEFKVHQGVRSFATTKKSWLETNYPIFEYNQKMHVLFVSDLENKTKSIFLNGIQIATETNVPFVAEDFEVEAITLLNNVHGKIYKFALYDKPLTNEEVVSIFKQEDKTYKTSVISTNEDITLRGIGDVRDTLDLITGEVIQSTGEVLLSEFNSYATTTGNGVYYIAKTHVAEDFATHHTLTIEPNEMIVKVYSEEIGNLAVQVVQKEDGSYPTRNELQAYLSQSPIVMQYERSLPISEMVNLASDYYFQAVTNQNIQVNGEIEPLVVSITVPTDALSFTLDPNQEAGQQFIAPDFMLMNETLAPLQIELKSFEQTTDVLNDVLPTKYDSWEGLDKQESQDIALALVPTPSNGWLSLNEGPRYVANTSDEFIGTVKGKSSVKFHFDALHGQAFSEVLNPEYRLSFVFGFVR